MMNQQSFHVILCLLALLIALSKDSHRVVVDCFEFGRGDFIDDHNYGRKQELERKRLVRTSNNDQDRFRTNSRRADQDVERTSAAATPILIDFMTESIDEVMAVREMIELSMSYSMSFPPSAPTVPPAPSAPVGMPTPSSPSTPTAQPPSVPSTPTSPTASGPTLPPTFSFEPSMTGFPTDDGLSSVPSDGPSMVPSASPTLSFEPSFTAEPSLSDISISGRPVGDGGTEDECPADSALSLGDSSDNTTTPVFLAVGYRVESTATTGNSSVFADSLGAELISTAVKAILGCTQDWDGLVFPQTTEIATCAPETGAPSCFIMETDAVFFFNGPIDEDQAVFDAYNTLQQSMLNDTYVGLVPTVVLVVYLSPSPLPLPPGDGGGNGGGPNDSEDPVDTVQTTNTNPIVIASVAGMAVLVGFVLVYARRKKRNSSVPLVEEETSDSNASQGGGAETGDNEIPGDADYQTA